jgi:hypothetical protein
VGQAEAGVNQDFGTAFYSSVQPTIASDDSTFFVHAYPYVSGGGFVSISKCRLFNPAASDPWVNCRDGSNYYTKLFSDATTCATPGACSIQIPSPLSDVANDGFPAWFGKALALSMSGPLGPALFIGAPGTVYSSSQRGSVYVYLLNSDTSPYSTPHQELAPPTIYSTGTNAVTFGASLALSGDESTLVIGAPYDADGRGNVWVYNLITSTYESIIPNPTAGLAGGYLGTSVTVNHYATTIVAARPCRGCANEHTAGSAVVYYRISTQSLRQRRYFYLQPASGKGIGVREIEITTSGGTNVAKYRPSILSSTYNFNPPWLAGQAAVDGLILSPLQNIAATDAVNGFLWIDLGHTATTGTIVEVKITNRVDCCQDQLAGATAIIVDYYGNGFLWATTLSGTQTTYTYAMNV